MSTQLIPLDKSVAQRRSFPNWNISLYEHTFPSVMTSETIVKNNVSATWTDYKSGFINPAWESMVKNGVDASTAYRRVGVSLHRVKGHFKEVVVRNAPAQKYTGTQEIAFIDDPFSGFSAPAMNDPALLIGQAASAANRCSILFYNRVADALRAFSVPIFLGEFHDLIALGLNPLRSIANLTRALRQKADSLRRIYATRPVKLSKALAELWLEYRLAIVPLQHDVVAFGEAMEMFFNSRADAKVISATCTDRPTATILYLNPTWRGYTCSGQLISRPVKSVKIIGCLDLRPIKGKDYGKVSKSATDAFGTSIREFFPTIWELIPLSFVVDYFTNIGKLLTASSYQNVKLNWAVTDYRLSVQYQRTISLPSRHFVSGYDTIDVEGFQVAEWDKFAFQRVPGVNESPRSIVVKMPSFVQAATLAALMRSFIL